MKGILSFYISFYSYKYSLCNYSDINALMKTNIPKTGNQRVGFSMSAIRQSSGPDTSLSQVNLHHVMVLYYRLRKGGKSSDLLRYSFSS